MHQVYILTLGSCSISCYIFFRFVIASCASIIVCHLLYMQSDCSSYSRYCGRWRRWIWWQRPCGSWWRRNGETKKWTRCCFGELPSIWWHDDRKYSRTGCAGWLAPYEGNSLIWHSECITVGSYFCTNCRNSWTHFSIWWILRVPKEWSLQTINLLMFCLQGVERFLIVEFLVEQFSMQRIGNHG